MEVVLGFSNHKRTLPETHLFSRNLSKYSINAITNIIKIPLQLKYKPYIFECSIWY